MSFLAMRKTNIKHRTEGPGKAPQNDNSMEIMKKICLSMLILAMVPLYAGAENEDENKNAEQFDWNPVMEAIILVESEGNPRVVNGNQVGAMQITPIMVRECNNILKARGSDLQYKMSDRYDVEKSKEMFLLIQSQYNKSNNVEKAIRSWNGGPNYSNRGTERYYQKVLRRMK